VNAVDTQLGPDLWFFSNERSIEMEMKTTTGGKPRTQEKRADILRAAARVFAAKGYHQASMRDIARTTPASLAGLYYHFPTKEEILYEISASTFDTVMEGAKAALDRGGDPETRLRAFVDNHLAYFAAHLTEMKVLSHESDSLTGERREQIQERKRRYVALAESLLASLDGNGQRGSKAQARETRLSTLALFGMMNWIYTWYRPGGEAEPPAAASMPDDIRRISRLMSELFLTGYAPGSGSRSHRAQAGSG
jgi:TetR/AcrR family transcriptional regulator, cholesterol catabolism regulator